MGTAETASVGPNSAQTENLVPSEYRHHLPDYEQRTEAKVRNSL